MATRLRQALRYWHTLRHLRASQVYWRLRYRVGNGYGRRYGAPQPLPALDPTAREGLRGFAGHWARCAPPDAARTDAFLLGRFTFLNKTIQSTNPLWRGLDVPKLWLYHLHYFDYARDVALLHPDPDGPGAARVRDWMLDWIRKNDTFDGPAWDAFPLSVRLMNWSLILAIYGWDDFAIRDSMHVQLDYLRQHLEYDLRGNHLLKNAAALTVAGTLLNSAHRKTGMALLKREVGAQFLVDGGHCERSPMYHGQALVDLLLATAVCEANPGWLSEPSQRAIQFLHGVTHGDGRAAQFNDGAADEPPAAEAALALSRKFYFGLALPWETTAFSESGMFRMAPGEDAGVLIVKAGETTLDHQPGHAHSDLLSFEYSLGERRFFVNAGTHGYAGSTYRNYCRSTAAQNTLRINGEEQQEHWSTFRVARRIHGAVDRWDEAAPQLRASYRSLKGPRHERAIAWCTGGWWRILDTVTGSGKLSVESFLHLHPGWESNQATDSDADPACMVYRIRAGMDEAALVIAGATRVKTVRGQNDPCQGWYFPRFGEALPATAFVMKASARNEVRLGYAIVPRGAGIASAAADLLRALTGNTGSG